MLGYYISPVIGDGTDDNPYRPKVANYNVNYACAFEITKKNWCLVVVNSNDHSTILADSQIFDISDELLDTTWGILQAAKRNKITQALSYVGISFTPINSTTLREIMNLFLGVICDSVDINNLHVAL